MNTIESRPPTGIGPRPSRLTTGFLAFVAWLALTGLFLAATPGTALLGLVSVGAFVASMMLLLRWPAGFLGVAMGSYGSLQVVLLRQEVFEIGSIEINASKAFILIVTFLLAFRISIHYLTVARHRVPPWAIFLTFLLATWVASTLVRSPLPEEAVAVVARMLAGAVAFLYAFVFVRSTKDLLPVWIGSALTTIVASVIALLELVQGRGAVEVVAVGAFRGSGGFGGAVATGTVAMYGMLFAAVVLAIRPFGSSQRLLALITIIAGALGIVVTFTRTAIFGTLVFVVLHVLASRRGERGASRRSRVFLATLLIAAVMAGFSLISSETLESRVADLPGAEGRPGLGTEAGSGRGLIWSTLLRLQLAASPGQWLIGHGLLAVPYGLSRSIGVSLDAHNSVLDLLYDTGVVGVILYVLAAWAMIRDLRRTREADLSVSQSLGRMWSYYVIAYFVSTEMFNGYVYAVGPRWYTLITTGAVLGLATLRSELGSAERRAELAS